MIRSMKISSDPSPNFGFVMKDIGRLYVKLFETAAEHLGITFAEAKVLISLSRTPAVSQIQLAEQTLVEPMSLVRILDRMERDGWIERRPHPTDRRAHQLHLTASAEPMLGKILKVSTQLRVQSLSGFRPEERAVLIGLLERLQEQLLHMTTEQTDKAAQRPPSADERKARPVGHSASSKGARTQRVLR